jgi:CIC family chloride channel protein
MSWRPRFRRRRAGRQTPAEKAEPPAGPEPAESRWRGVADRLRQLAARVGPNQKPPLETKAAPPRRRRGLTGAALTWEGRIFSEGWTSWRTLGSRLGSRISAFPYAQKWVVLGITIGVVAGLGAIAFYTLLQVGTHLFLTDLAGYHIPTPGGEGDHPGSAGFSRPWAIPLVVGLGGLLSGLLIFTWAPEAEGHGTDAAIESFHRNPRGIRLRAVAVKMVASAITIGSGGSGGREGPTAQISAGFGSLLARVLDLSPEDGRLAVAVGIGSGIGAIFSAPLGGAVLAADILYRDDFEFAALLPGLAASSVAYVIFGAVESYRPLFLVFGGYHFNSPGQLIWFAVIGVLAGGIGLLYAKSFYFVVGLNARLPFSRKLRPALGGLLVGAIALGLPEVLGTGYGWVQKGLGPDLLQIPLYAVLLLPLARILATSLSIGTGGSGGVFGPGVVIGAFTGAAVWRILAPLAPWVPHDPAAFVVVGMMACFGSIARAPLAVMLMVAEMTGTVALLVPAMVAVAIATLIVRRFDDSIYRSQLRTRSDSPASRLQFGLPLLGGVLVSAVANEPRLVLTESMPIQEALAAVQEASVPGAPVVDGHGIYLGTVPTEVLERAAAMPDPAPNLSQLVDATSPTIAATARLDQALESITQAGGHWVTVTDGARHVRGVLTFGDVMAGYQQALSSNLGIMTQVSSHTMSLEERIGAGSPLAGRPLRSVQLPDGCIVVTVLRGPELTFASGSTVLEPGDVVSALASPSQSQELRRLMRGAEGPIDPAVERGGQLL